MIYIMLIVAIIFIVKIFVDYLNNKYTNVDGLMILYILGFGIAFIFSLIGSVK